MVSAITCDILLTATLLTQIRLRALQCCWFPVGTYTGTTGVYDVFRTLLPELEELKGGVSFATSHGKVTVACDILAIFSDSQVRWVLTSVNPPGIFPLTRVMRT